MSRPSWAQASPDADRPATGVAERPPAVLVAASAGVVALTAVEVAVVATRDDLLVPLRAVLVALLGLQVPLAVLALRRSAAATMVLLLCALSAAVASLAAGAVAGAAGAVVVLVLLARSLRWFPAVELWQA